MRHRPFEASAYGGSYIEAAAKRKRNKKHKTVFSEIKTMEEKNEKL